ncbi:ATP-binding protein [Streptomyces cyaneochromogenes]|uniref:ATP-binding protein n=1 Tax=Streptomyces cyaneochromogenes TaxID=2496836 RepID=A0A3S9M796_9ACTN|nr:ATP-binding protein [Streptomyces cyaneochromogenes]AZQ35017.1 ATP-binding protein [Streptomyces cyaneochromogenes]
MIYVNGCVGREPWVQQFVAQASELSQLRRTLKLQLILWGLREHVDAAEICLSELATNVIQHVGQGTPATLRLALSGPYLRLEIEDCDARALPTLLAASSALESGRGMALVDALSEHRWGVEPRGRSKVVWCELAVDSSSAGGQATGPRVTRAEAILDLYGSWRLPHGGPVPGEGSVLSMAVAEDAAIGVMADMLHWLRAHGFDPDDVLDRAQSHFEAEVGEVV